MMPAASNPEPFSGRNAATAIANIAFRPGISVAFLAALVICAQVLFFTTYDSNDDVFLRMMLAGRLVPGAQPTPDVYFCNLVLGSVLAAAYRALPQVPWYDLYEQVTLAIAFVVAVRLVQLFAPARYVVGVLAVLSAAFFAVFVTPQFMAVAMMAATVGAGTLVWQIIGPLAQTRPGNQAGLASAAGIALILGGLLRFEAGILAIIAAILTVGIIAWRHRSSQRLRIFWMPALILLGAMAVSATLAVVHFRFYALQPEWAKFAAFNFYRAAITEYLPHGSSAAMPVGGGLSVTDRLALANWSFFDPSVFSIERMRSAALGYWQHKIALKTVISLVPSFILSLRVAAPVLLAILGLAIWRRDRQFTWTTTFTCTAVLALAFAIAASLKLLPWRGLWPLGTCLFLFLSLVPSNDRPLPPFQTGRHLLAVAVALIVLITGISSWRSYCSAKNVESAALASHLGASKIAIVVGSALPVEAVVRPFHDSEVGRDYRLIWLSSMFLSPVMQSALAATPYANVADDLCGSKQLAVIAKPDAIASLSAYFKEHRKRTVVFEPVYQGRAFDVFRCRYTAYAGR